MKNTGIEIGDIPEGLYIFRLEDRTRTYEGKLVIRN
jgi:hypothetical protein